MIQIDTPARPVGAHGRDTSIDTATPIPIPDGARYVMLAAYAQNLRYTLDGTTPTTAIGFLVVKDAPPVTIYVETGVTLQVISATAGAEVQYQFYN